MEALKLTPTMRPTLRACLQDATADRHARLDAMFEHMLDDNEERTLYREFIAMNLAAHEAIEPLLSRSPLATSFPSLRDHGRRDALRADAEALGVEAPALPAFEPSEPDRAEAVGIAYVLEGSRLGATMMHRHWEKMADAGADTPSRLYLSASQGGAAFRDFMEVAGDHPWTDEEFERAGRAAARTFDYFTLAASRARGTA